MQQCTQLCSLPPAKSMEGARGDCGIHSGFYPRKAISLTLFLTILCRNRSKRDKYFDSFSNFHKVKKNHFFYFEKGIFSILPSLMKAEVVAIRHLRTEIGRLVELCSTLLKNSRVITSHTILRDSIWKERYWRKK